jgi:type VI secretion system protein ImpC
LESVCEGEAYAAWRSFRDSDTAAFVGLVLPRILLRLPYRPDTVPLQALPYQETVQGPGHNRPLWGNPAYALGIRMAEAFRLYGWCANIQGVESGGLVTGLPAYTALTEEGQPVLVGPTEVPIVEPLDVNLHRLGLISLIHWKGTNRAAFFSVPSCRRPAEYLEAQASAAATLSARLAYVLAVSRFAHYLKALTRDRRGGPLSREDCERYLNAWISEYVVQDDEAGLQVKARYPLREARVEVHEVPDRPGALFAVAYLRPHFQLADPGLCLRVVAELPAAAPEA